MVTITARYSFDWLKNVKTENKKITSGMILTYQAILRCAYGKNFTWVTTAGIANITGQHPVTIWRNIKKLIAAGIIAKGENCRKKGFYLLAHPELVAHMIKRGIKYVITAISDLVAGDEKQEQDEAVQGQKECEIEAQKNCILQSENCEMQSPLYKGDENEVPPLPPKGQDDVCEPCKAVSEQREDCGIKDDKQPPPIVGTVLAEIGQEHALIPLVALVKSSIINVDGSAVQIRADRYSLKIIKRHLAVLEEAFHRHGITAVSLFVMSESEEKQHTENLLARERQESATRQRQARYAAQQAETAERQRMEKLSEKEQFRLLAASYPSPENGYTEIRAWNFWPAWTSYIAMRKTGEIPPIFDVLRVLQQQKLSKDWNRDNGRWIPSLFKWLNNRPWVNDFEKEKNGPTEHD